MSWVLMTYASIRKDEVVRVRKEWGMSGFSDIAKVAPNIDTPYLEEKNIH